MQSVSGQPICGNNMLVSGEEDRIVEMLREKNLKYTNLVSQEVHPKNTMYSRMVKRILDVAIALPAFILTLPLNCVFAVLTYLDVGRPILYRQTRVGKNGKYFTIVKFRNMNEEKDSEGRLLPPSQRVTKLGRVMRKYSLDELLSLWCVVRGDMSIIGPRPQPVFLYERMSERHKQRVVVKPGLECPRIIHIKGEETYKYQRTFENDIWYVENLSFITDIKMVLLLIKMVFSFKRRGKQAKGEGITYFVGYDESGYAISLKNYRELVPQNE